MHSRYPDVEIPHTSLADYVLAQAAALADTPAIIDGVTGERITYAETAAQVVRTAGALSAMGLQRGDVVAIISPNSIWYPVVFHGIVSAGCVASPINPLYTAAEIAHQLRDCGARVIFTVPAFAERVVEAAALCPVEHVVVIGESTAGLTTLQELLDADHPAPSVPGRLDTDLAALPYSSGTTGLPKGVMLTHRNLVANIAQFREMQDIRPGDERLIAVLPFFHIYGLTVLMNFGLQAGITVVTMPRFELREFLRIVQDERITRACVAPPIMLALAKDPLVDEYDLSSLRVLLSGAAPLDAALATACQQRLGAGVSVLQGYGMTELSPVSHTSPDPGREPAGFGPAPFGTIGYAAPQTECRLVDTVTGLDAEPGRPGELWVRGPQVMAGYLHNPEATAQTLDEQGWLHTGDVATVDEAGCYSIVDRVKELIKYKGYQVAPAELEAILLTSPDVLDAAVIASPDAEAGEIPKAFVVRSGGSSISADSVMEYVTTRVAPYKKIRQVVFVDQIPKSASGKILRRQLRDG